MQTGIYRVTFSLPPEIPSHITELPKIVILECHFNCHKFQQFLLFTDSSYTTITATKNFGNIVISSLYRWENWGAERVTCLMLPRKSTVNMFLECKCLTLCFVFHSVFLLYHSFHHILFLLPSNSSANLALLYTLNFTDPYSQALSSVICVPQCHHQLWFSHGCPDQICGHSLPVSCPFSKLCCLFSASIPFIVYLFILQLCLTWDGQASLQSNNNLFSCNAGIVLWPWKW